MEYFIKLEAEREITKEIKRLVELYLSKGAILKELKKYWNRDKNFLKLLKDINYVSFNLFKNETEYQQTVKKIIDEVMSDKNAYQKDLKVKKFENFEFINEVNLPIIKLTEILDNVDYATSVLKKVLVTKFKIAEEYIDLADKKSHLYKINDIKGDLLGNNRVIFDAIIFSNNDIIKIKDNIVDYCIGDFYKQLPLELNIFGISLKPVSFVDKEILRDTFKGSITFDETLNIITAITKLNFEGRLEDFYIWSNLNSIKKQSV